MKNKEREWIKLVGKDRWNRLPSDKKEFLIRTAGILYLGRVDIRKIYRLGRKFDDVGYEKVT